MKPLFRLFFILGLLAHQSTHAAVNDILPSDFYPLSPGTTTLSLYAFDRAYVGPYAHGNKLLDGHLDNSAYVLRAVRGVQVCDTTVGLVAVLPWSHTETSPEPLPTLLGQASEGFSDLRLGATAWLINDKANANYLALSGMVIAPTGKYDKTQILNPGENRWRYILFGGWQKDITPSVLFELSPELALYGDNDDYAANHTLEQRPSYALTGYLRWRTAPRWHLFVGGQLNRGGETRIDGVDQNNPANNRRVMAGVTWFLPEKQQLILRVARDTYIDNGFKLNRELVIRYQKSF